MIRNILLLLLISSSATAQITLENDYTYKYHYQTVNVVNIEDDGYKYYILDTLAKRIDLYNTDHSHWKSIGNGGVSYGASYISKKLFNNDNSIEFITYSYNTSTGKIEAHVMNENGNILKTFTGTTQVAVYKVDNNYKLRVFYADSPAHTEIYSLPGKYLSLQKPGKGEQADVDLYPNPMSEAATLTYTLPAGVQRGQVDIFNSSGAHLRGYQVTNQFNNIIIQRGELPPGNYVYKVSAQGVAPVANLFVIK